MLDTLRRGATSKIAAFIIFIPLIFAFAIWGVADVFRGYGQGAVARIGKTEISTEQFQQAYQNELSQMSQQFGRRLTPEMARMLGIESRVLSRLVGTAALDTQARDLGLALSEQVIAESIRRDPGFFGIDGKFSKPNFDNVLRQNGLSERTFVNLRRREEVREQLTDGIISGVTVPQAFIEQQHRHREETRVVELLTIDAAKVVKVADPDDAALKVYYEANKRQFMSPEYRKLAVLLLTSDAVKAKIVIPDDDVKAAYEADKDRYNTLEKRRILQVAFPNKAAADTAYTALAAAKNFIEAAGKLGFKESDVDLGTVTRRELIDSKIADAAFALKKDEVSKPVEGQFTTVILRVTDIAVGKIRGYDEVKAEVTDKLAGERASREIQALHDKVDDDRLSGRTLKDVGQKLGLAFSEIEASDRTAKTPDGKAAFDHPDAARIMQTAFGGAAGAETDSMELNDGGYAWFDILAVTPAKEKPFETVQTDARTGWIAAEKSKALGETAAKFIERLLKGESLEAVAKDAGGKAERTPAITRATSPQGLSADGVRQAFALPKNSASSVATPDGGSRTIFRVAEVTPAPPPTKEQSDRIRGELQRTLQGDAINAYVAALQTRYGVAVNDAVVRQTLGLDK